MNVRAVHRPSPHTTRSCAFAALVLAALALIGAGVVLGRRPRSVDTAVRLVQGWHRDESPAWKRRLPQRLRHSALFRTRDRSPEEVVADILRNDLPRWTPAQRTDFFARGLYGAIGWNEPWLLADILLDSGNETGWNDKGRLELPPSGVLPDWESVRRRKLELEGPQADATLLPFDVALRWRIALVPSAQGHDLVLSRRDGSCESRWETRLPADHNPAIDPACYDPVDQRVYMEFGNFVRVQTNDCNAQVYEIRPVAGSDSPEAVYELCVPTAPVFAPNELPPAP